LTEQEIGIGDRVHLLSRQPFDGPCEVNIGDRRHNLGVTLARAIHVEHI
jgi:Fe2+ transport system protein FeoA